MCELIHIISKIDEEFVTTLMHLVSPPSWILKLFW